MNSAVALPWLRDEGNMRTAPVVLAAEAIKARLGAGLAGGNRQLVGSVLRRGDEPGEMMAYWTSTYGRAVPQPVKRGIADAVARLYDERAFLRYDSTARGFRFGDVIDLVHPWRSRSGTGTGTGPRYTGSPTASSGSGGPRTGRVF
jgi:hypothetical protein